MNKPKLYADFNNADLHGRLRLNCEGTFEDLARFHLELKEGMSIILDDQDELSADGIVSFSAEERCWVATIDWNAIRHTNKANRHTDLSTITNAFNSDAGNLNLSNSAGV